MSVWPAIEEDFQLRTPRLRLRCPRHADAPQVAELAGDREVAEMTANIPHPYPEGAAQTFVARARESTSLGRDLTLMITMDDNDAIIAGLVSARPGPGDCASIAYWVGRRYWGRGIATEAVDAAVAAIFARTDASAVVTNVRVTNPASARVLEQCGFRRVGLGEQRFPARGQVFPVAHFRIDRNQHAAGG